MRLLIAVKSCQRDRYRGAHQLIRDTWGADVVDADLAFFIGARRTEFSEFLDDDEVFVYAPDDYAGLAHKTREIVRYATMSNYDYVFLCDTGSFVIPHHLMACGFEKFDYMGYFNLIRPTPFNYNTGDPHKEGCSPMLIKNCYPWASGGGYFLSRKAMQIIADNDPVTWAEDLNVGQLLGRNGILLEDAGRTGYNGYVVSWICGEDNDAPDAMAARRLWMEYQQAVAKERCATGCNSPDWIRYEDPRVWRDMSDPNEVAIVLQERIDSWRNRQ